jgi:hypothetical protein
MYIIMKSKYNTKQIISTKPMKLMGEKEKITLRITRKQQKMITKNDVEDINATFRHKLGHNIFAIICYNDGSHPWTLKPLNGDLNLSEIDEYIEGKVNMDNMNFVDEFYKLYIIFDKKK